MRRSLVACVCTALLAACAHTASRPETDPLPQVEAVVIPDQGPDRVSAALGYFQYLQTLDQNQLLVEYRRAANAFALAPTLEGRIQLILLLMEPRARFRNLDVALELIDGYLENAPPSPTTDFVWLLEAGVQAQRRADQDLSKEARRANELQQKIDELRSIDRQIDARESPGLK